MAAKKKAGKKPAKKKPAAKVKKKPASDAKKKQPAAKKKPAVKKKPAADRPSARQAGATVDDYVKQAGAAHAKILGALRKLVRKAAPGATESIKWGQPVYEDNGPFAYLAAHKRHVNLGFWRGVELPDPRGLLEGAGGKMRHVRIASTDDMDKDALSALVRSAVQLNRDKGDPSRAP